MAKSRGTVTAHVTRIVQDTDEITTIAMSEGQVLELISLLTVALREKAAYKDGYRLALWKGRPVKQCQADPPCSGGKAGVVLVRPRKA